MRSGTPAFKGDRLKVAREARGLSAASLSELIGVSRQAVSLYEKGTSTPSPDVMRRIADTLKFPSHFFLKPTAQAEEGGIFYRSMSAATKAARTRAERRFGLAHELVHYLTGFVELPRVNMPSVEVQADPTKISAEQVEDAAIAARRFWKLGDGPISNVTMLIENNGGVVLRHELDSTKLDAFSTWSSDGRPYVVLGTEKGSAVRSRFDLAHELGHLVLHREVSGQWLRLSDVFKAIESQAHEFASAFLMPANTFGAEMPAVTLDALRSMKPRWKVSIQAMIARAHRLELITDEQKQKLFMGVAARGWRTKEPLDDEIPPEEPRLLRRSVELVLKAGAATRRDIAFQAAMPAEDIERLINLSPDTLTESAEALEDDPFEPKILKFPNAG